MPVKRSTEYVAQWLTGSKSTATLLIERTAPQLVITQDLGLGMLWMTQFFPEEGWAVVATGAMPGHAR